MENERRLRVNRIPLVRVHQPAAPDRPERRSQFAVDPHRLEHKMQPVAARSLVDRATPYKLGIAREHTARKVACRVDRRRPQLHLATAPPPRQVRHQPADTARAMFVSIASNPASAAGQTDAVAVDGADRDAFVAEPDVLTGAENRVVRDDDRCCRGRHIRRNERLGRPPLEIGPGRRRVAQPERERQGLTHALERCDLGADLRAVVDEQRGHLGPVPAWQGSARSRGPVDPHDRHTFDRDPPTQAPTVLHRRKDRHRGTANTRPTDTSRSDGPCVSISDDATTYPSR